MSGQILKNVSRGSFYLATEQLSGLMSGILYSIVVLRWLGPEGYGLLTLGLAIVALTSVATGNFEVFLERFSAEYETRGMMNRLKRAHALSLGLKVGLGLIAAAVLVSLSRWLGLHYEDPGWVTRTGLLFADWLGLLFKDSRLIELLGILAGLIIFEGFSVTGRAVLFGLQRFGWIAATAVVFHTLKIIAVIALWTQGGSVMGLAVALVAIALGQGLMLTALAALFVRRGRSAVGEPVAAAVQSIASDVPMSVGEKSSPVEEPPLLSSLIHYCLPLLGARAAYLTGQNMSKVALGGFLSLEQLGYFSFAFTVVERFVALIYALPSSLLPSFTQLLSRGMRVRFAQLLDKAFRLVATAAVALSFGLLVFAREITEVVGGEQYLAAVPVLLIMALVPWVRTSHQPLTMAFYALKRTSSVLLLALIKLATELGAYFVLIPLLGVRGAATAHLLGAAVALTGALLLIGESFPPARHRWAVMAKTTVLLILSAAAMMALAGASTGWVTLLALKLLILSPAFLLSVFLFDLVTEDDLRRAGSIDIRISWMRQSRDRLVAGGLRLSRAVSPLRPAILGTVEGN